MNRLPIPAFVTVAALALAGSAAAAGLPNLPPGWSHAEINVIVKHARHTLTYDRGRVQSVTASSLTLREPDGNLVTIDVSAAAQITIAGQPGLLSQIRPREIATTLEIDAAPATKVTVRIPPAVAAQIAAQARRQARGKP